MTSSPGASPMWQRLPELHCLSLALSPQTCLRLPRTPRRWSGRWNSSEVAKLEDLLPQSTQCAEPPRLQVFVGLHDLCTRIHHEGPIAHDGFIDGYAAHQQECAIRHRP